MRPPDFLILGAQKCGTSAARHNLAQHPHVRFNTNANEHREEVHFFDNDHNWARGIQWYAAQFQQPAPLLGDKTPNYLAPRCIERIRVTLPGARLIVLLRNPVARAYSHWNHFNRNPASGNGRWRIRAFENALQENPTLQRNGEYATSIALLQEYFPPALLGVWITERMQANHAAEHARMLKFLGLAPHTQTTLQHRHTRQYDETMRPATRARLEQYFAAPNDRLRALLNDPIPEWP